MDINKKTALLIALPAAAIGFIAGVILAGKFNGSDNLYSNNNIKVEGDVYISGFPALPPHGKHKHGHCCPKHGKKHCTGETP